jgi:hypothetical protein
LFHYISRGLYPSSLQHNNPLALKNSTNTLPTEGSAFEVGPQADRLYHALADTKLPIGDLVGDCIGMGAPVAGNLTQQASLLIDLYLSPGYEKYKERIVELAHMDPAASERELQGFVYEGMRHVGVVPGLPRVATRDVTVDDGVRGPVTIKASGICTKCM